MSVDVQNLQHTINRFYGNLIGSPIAEDGVVGPETKGALDTIVNLLPGMGYQDESTTIAAQFYASNYNAVASALGSIADAQGWAYSVPGGSAGGGGSGGGLISRLPKLPQSAASALDAVGKLPTWAKIGGVLGAIAILWWARQSYVKAKQRSLSGFYRTS